MLVLTRSLGQRIFIGPADDPRRIALSIERIDGGQIRIGIEAPRDVIVLREEHLGEPRRDAGAAIEVEVRKPC